MNLDHAYIAGMFSDSDLFYKLRLSPLRVCTRVHEPQRVRRDGRARALCVEGRGRGPVRAFAGLCCRSNRLRTAGSCDTCDACSDENADRGGGGGGGGELGGGPYCSGELMSSRGPLFILDGSMDPHCACGFCSRWFFRMDFSPSVKHTQAS